MSTTSKKTTASAKAVKVQKDNSIVAKKNGSHTSSVVSGAYLHQALQEHFGFDSFKGNQEPIIKSLLAGKDTFVIKPTGGGKSLCYQLPAIISDGVAIIIS